jgi:hypothetical protein
MRRSRNFSAALIAATLLSTSGGAITAYAGEVEIVHTHFRGAGGEWSVDVTLRHGDTGWDHYADAWRVVGGDGTIFGTRTLYHPHENEQPFTRSLGGVAIPADMSTVYVEAHDKVHGWSPQRVQVDLRKSKGERFEVSR